MEVIAEVVGLYALAPLVLLGLFTWTPAGKTALRKLGNKLTKLGLSKEEYATRMAQAHLKELPEEIKRQEEVRAAQHRQVMLIETIREETYEHERKLLDKAYQSKLEGGDYTPLQPELLTIALPAPKSEKEKQWEAAQRSYMEMQAAGAANVSSAALGQYQPDYEGYEGSVKILADPRLDALLRNGQRIAASRPSRGGSFKG